MARGYGYGPAAGAPGGAAPRLARLHVPDFIRYATTELETLVNVLRDPLAGHVYLLLCIGSVFETGEFLGSYARLIELCTPPQPERGRRRAGPTYRQLRRVVADLAAAGLVRRATGNEEQGQLRLYVIPRKGQAPARLSETGRRELQKLRSVAASATKEGRV